MKTNTFRKSLACALSLGVVGVHSLANAGPGYMAFLPTETPVTTGEAASYMRAGSDWDGTMANVVNNIAVPTVAQASKISTWRDSVGLHFRFEIPDRTPLKPDGTKLACGDQIIVQIGPAKTGDTSLQAGKEFRFQVAIPNMLGPVPVQLFLPHASGGLLGSWKSAAQATTAATASQSAAAPTYAVTLNIPYAEIGFPGGETQLVQAGGVGLAVAILNDLGHSHGTAPVTHEATGTTFPIGMGLLPASDPVFSCGVSNAPTPESVTLNWKNPSTWGTGYVNPAAVAGDVTLAQGPHPSFSRSIRIGRCTVREFNDITEVTLANWEAIQQSVADNWYKFNTDEPCRMTIWIDAKVAGTGIVKKRFMAVWGRPGIAPKDWYFVGLTEPVAISAPNTPVTLIWNKPTPVPFTGHPCLQVYVLPESLTAQQIADIQAIDTQTKLNKVVNDIVLPQGTEKSAQMNFSNTAAGKCSEPSCLPLSSAIMGVDESDWAQSSFIRIANAQGADEFRGDDRPPDDWRGDDYRGDGKRSNLVRVVAHGFGVAEPQGNRPYTYVETIGQVGWAIPSNLFAQEPLPLVFEVANPAVTESMFADGSVVEIPSPPRLILVALVTDVVTGDPVPKLDTSGLAKFAETAVKPGEVATAQVSISIDRPVPPPSSWWLWVLLLLILVVLIGLLIDLWRRP